MRTINERLAYNYMEHTWVHHSILNGKTIEKAEIMDNEIWIYTNVFVYKLFHHQYDIETVNIVNCDIDLSTIKDEQVLSCSLFDKEETDSDGDFIAWQFFKLTTDKNCFTIAIFGRSYDWYNKTMDLYQYPRVSIQ